MKNSHLLMISAILAILSFLMFQDIQRMRAEKQESVIAMPKRKPIPPIDTSLLVYEELLAGMNATKTVKGYPLPIPEYR